MAGGGIVEGGQSDTGLDLGKAAEGIEGTDDGEPAGHENELARPAGAGMGEPGPPAMGDDGDVLGIGQGKDGGNLRRRAGQHGDSGFEAAAVETGIDGGELIALLEMPRTDDGRQAVQVRIGNNGGMSVHGIGPRIFHRRTQQHRPKSSPTAAASHAPETDFAACATPILIPRAATSGVAH